MAGAALAAPGAAQAATKTVSMGIPGASAKAFPVGTEANAYFPASVTIRTGDIVSFAVGGFHTVHLPAKGKFSPSQIPLPAASGILDAAGVPFWFNGQQSATFSPKILGPSGFGKTLPYSGAKETVSGLPPFGPTGPPKPVKVRFTKAGLFRYICDIHPGMAGTVRVNAKSKGAPSAAADAKRVKTQVASALAVAKGLATTKAPANTVIVGPEGKGDVTLFGMVPGNLSIPAGTTVTFRMPAGSTEVHTASFGPGAETFGGENEPDKTTYLGGVAAGFSSDAGDARADFPSEQPGTPPAAFSPLLHGNGFWNSGVMDAVSASPLPPSGQLTFGTPGVFTYVCLVHTNMKATITVT